MDKVYRMRRSYCGHPSRFSFLLLFSLSLSPRGVCVDGGAWRIPRFCSFAILHRRCRPIKGALAEYRRTVDCGFPGRSFSLEMPSSSAHLPGILLLLRSYKYLGGPTDGNWRSKVKNDQRMYLFVSAYGPHSDLTSWHTLLAQPMTF